MQSDSQFEQLMMQYKQLKAGAEDISLLIDKENYDSALTMINNREQIFLNCKCMRKYLELTPIQQKELDKLLDEIRDLEMNNIKKIEKGMQEIQQELVKSQKTEKLKNAYGVGDDSIGSIVNFEEL